MEIAARSDDKVGWGERVTGAHAVASVSSIRPVGATYRLTALDIALEIGRNEKRPNNIANPMCGVYRTDSILMLYTIVVSGTGMGFVDPADRSLCLTDLLVLHPQCAASHT